MEVNIDSKAYSLLAFVIQFVHFNAILIVSAFTHLSEDYASLEGK